MSKQCSLFAECFADNAEYGQRIQKREFIFNFKAKCKYTVGHFNKKGCYVSFHFKTNLRNLHFCLRRDVKIAIFTPSFLSIILLGNYFSKLQENFFIRIWGSSRKFCISTKISNFISSTNENYQMFIYFPFAKLLCLFNHL